MQDFIEAEQKEFEKEIERALNINLELLDPIKAESVKLVCLSHDQRLIDKIVEMVDKLIDEDYYGDCSDGFQEGLKNKIKVLTLLK